MLCDLFADVLGVPEVSIDDAFFDLGGDSIVSLQLVSKARRAGLKFTARDLFEHKTVAELATVVTVPQEQAASPRRRCRRGAADADHALAAFAARSDQRLPPVRHRTRSVHSG